MTTVKIKGMRCQHCVKSATKALQVLDGVANVRVDLEKEQATFDGDVSRDVIKEAIAKIGFEVVE
jgi:copper chaperone